MKVPLSWLKAYVDLREDAASVARALVAAGVGVEGVAGIGNDAVLDLEVTANRADLLSMRGVARELSLLGRPSLPDPAISFQESGEAAAVSVRVEDPGFCPRYIGRVLRDVRVGPSPVWMRERLERAGLRPINVVADVTNFVMLECGQPLHAFDLSKWRGSEVVVRRARAEERIVAIDGKEYPLGPGDGVIADGAGPVAVAGVMGGRDSEISEATRDVLLESAQFDPVSVRRASRRLGLKSESSYRFERGVEWSTVEWASRRAAHLLAELAGAKPAPGASEARVSAPEPRWITMRFRHVVRLLGMEIPPSRMYEILEKLGCRIEKADADAITLIAPPARRDLKGEIDLVEEIARITGYDLIPVDLGLGLKVAADAPRDRVMREIRSVLVTSGAFEVLTSSFEEAHAQPLTKTWSQAPLVPLRNPEGHVDRTLRSSLAPSLLRVLRTNEGSKVALRPIFEIAKVYRSVAPGVAHSDPDLGRDRSPFDERWVVGMAVPSGYADARALVERILNRLQIPGHIQGASIQVEGRAIGVLSIPERALQELGVLAPAAVAELDFDALAARAALTRKVRPHSTHPAVVRDVSMTFAEDVPWEDVRACIAQTASSLLVVAELFDVFRDRKLGDRKKSLAFSLTFLAADRTLSGAEVDAIVADIRRALQERLGGEERR
ncbi:MAG: phenylalanine--tRNA ligase subunit beta [Planctomycetes bacterium]|nr:phenylalanine--tRNA ligase subunit beta [Planctomycetota bacterium]